MGENCETCRFWSQYVNNKGEGACCRYPPTVSVVPIIAFSATSGFETKTRRPETKANQWCGEHQPKDGERDPPS